MQWRSDYPPPTLLVLIAPLGLRAHARGIRAVCARAGAVCGLYSNPRPPLTHTHICTHAGFALSKGWLGTLGVTSLCEPSVHRAGTDLYVDREFTAHTRADRLFLSFPPEW